MRMTRTRTALLGAFAPLILSGLPAGAGSAQTSLFPPEQLARIQSGVAAVYNLEHDRGIATYQAMIRDSPNDPTGYVYLARTYWLKELVAKQELSIDRFAASDFFAETPKYRPQVDPQAEDRFRRTSEQGIGKARSRLEKNPNDLTALFLLGLAYQDLASFEASLKRSWWASFRMGSKAHKYHQRLLRENPSYYDAYLSSGVFQYVTASIPWSIKWLSFLLGYRGSKERGKEELRKTAEKALLAGDDARVILTLIYTREKNFQSAFDEMSILLKRYPKNYLVHLDMGGIALLTKRPDAAITIYQDILRKVEEEQHSYDKLERATVQNRLGVAFRHKGELETSAGWFHKVLEGPATSSLAGTVARLELGKTHDLMGRRTQARRQYQAVLAAEDFAGSRDEARRLLGRSYQGR